MRKKKEIELDLAKVRLEKEGEKPQAVKLERYTIYNLHWRFYRLVKILEPVSG